MLTDFFINTFKDFPLPVLVARIGEGFPLVCVNTYAQILLNPHLTVSRLEGIHMETVTRLDQVLRFPDSAAFDDLVRGGEEYGRVDRYRTGLLNFENREIPVSISCSRVSQGQEFLLFVLQPLEPPEMNEEAAARDLMGIISQTSYHTASPDEALNKILRLAGRHVGASRAYIFEEISPLLTANTYEWCDDGVEPFIQNLQRLWKMDYNYDAIVQGGAYITSDVRELPDKDRVILEAQGIRALAILPMYAAGRALGYIGFDDCREHRQWSVAEVGILQSVSSVASSLVVRRKNEEQVRRSLENLQIISDSIDNVIYANTLDTFEIVFSNRALSDALGKSPEELLGRKCWQQLQKDMDGPCEFCPQRSMLGENGEVLRETYTWEFQNTINGKWYLVKDSIAKWVDGRDVHIETAIDITYRKQYEQQLELVASRDAMTGTYNRDWGYRMMKELLAIPALSREEISLCFLDLDGLKKTNDTCGHDVGDDMILTTVEMISAAIRKSDMVCRWGGDEFILLLRCDTVTAERIVQNIQQRMEEVNRTGEKPYTLSFSYGISDFRDAGLDSLDALITEADRKMYENKMAKRQQRRTEDE